MLNEKDTTTLKRLACEYMEYASLPIQDKKREMWLRHNRHDNEKPMVLIDQMPWNELDVDGSLVCTVSDPYWRGIETGLRQQIYKWKHLPADMVLNPYIVLPRPITDTGFGVPVDKETKSVDPSSGVLSQKFNDRLSTEEDLLQLHKATVTLNTAAENEIKETASVLFGGITQYKMGGVCMHLGIWDWIAQARSVTDCYIDLIDRPEFMHKIMDILTDALIDSIKQYNAIGGFDAVSNVCHCSQIFSDDLPGDCDTENATSEHVWAFGLAQLFSSVSPDITAEFEVPYMQKIFPYFGAVYYGCCDRLDDRLDIIDRMPKIRKISCSPWSDRESFAANLPKKYIMSNKPTPALLAGDSFDEQAVRDDLRRTIAAAKAHDIRLEMILKDISTVRYDPQRLWRWAQIAAEETAMA